MNRQRDFTETEIASSIETCIKFSMAKLRRYQDLIRQQVTFVIEGSNSATRHMDEVRKEQVLADLDMMGEIYRAAIDVKAFKRATPAEWAKDIRQHMEAQK